MREDIFSKFKDYNNELEKILEKKDFSKDSKNLLLSMFYKLEISYNDYEKVKRKVKTKQLFLENILENVKYCNSIILIEPNTDEFDNLKKENKVFDVDLKMRRIRIINNELNLLSAILELNNFKIYLPEKYNLIRNAFPYVLNTGNDMDNTEVLRDFNAFSWNINENEIENVYVKIIYENLKLALSKNLINTIEKSENTFDLINFLKENLEENYEKNDVNNFLNLIFKLSILLYINISKIERKRLKEEKIVINEELDKIKNKKEYINEIIEKKINLNKKVKNLDLILKNDELLLKEFDKKNENESKKFFNINHFKEQLKREREKNIKKIEDCNLKLDPQNFIENKNKIQKDFELIEDINFEEDNENLELIIENLDKLKKIFLEKILPKKIEMLKTKEELIDLIYQIRYYNFIPYGNKGTVSDNKKFKDLISKNISMLLSKLYKMKLINTMSTNIKNDIEIIKEIFYIKTINLDDIYIELMNKENNKYAIYIYDDKETLEYTNELDIMFNPKDKIKLKRKVKLFK